MVSLLPLPPCPTARTVPIMWWAHSHVFCSLCDTKITDVGAEAIALALKENKTLTSLM